MAAATELESFVQKFRQLWKSGHDARLEFVATAGKASVALHLQLGEEPGPVHDHRGQNSSFSNHRNSSSRERRRFRRAENRVRNSNSSEENQNATEKVDTKLSDDANSKVD